MKKLMLTALAIVISTTTLFASNVIPEDSNKNIRNQIIKLMDTPEFELNNDTAITINFTFNSEGEIIVLSVDSKNRDILNYVRKNINHKTIVNPGEKDKVYTMPLIMKKG